MEANQCMVGMICIAIENLAIKEMGPWEILA